MCVPSGLSLRTWTVGHRVEVTVGQHEVRRPGFGLQLDSHVGDAVVEAGEAPEEVDGEGARGPLHVHAETVRGPRRRHLGLDVLDLLQQVGHSQHLILRAAHRPRAHSGDAFQVPPGGRG